jgi:hypothetical protein
MVARAKIPAKARVDARPPKIAARGRMAVRRVGKPREIA